MPVRKGTIFIDGPEKKESSPQVKEEAKKLDTLTKKANRNIFTASPVWPFDFFGSKLIIDETKVDVIHRLFFHSAEVQSFLLDDVTNATITTDLFFGTLMLNVKAFGEPQLTLKYLKKSDALVARRVINGLLSCRKDGIDISKFDPAFIRQKVEEIGRTTETI